MTIESFRLKIKQVEYLVSWYISFAHHFKNTKIYKYTKIYNCTLIRTPRSMCVFGNTLTAINLPHMQLLWHQKVFLGKKRDEEQHQPRKKIYLSFNINWFLFCRHPVKISIWDFITYLSISLIFTKPIPDLFRLI